MPSSKLVHSETYTRGGINYEIRVIQTEGGLWGEWTCGKCGQSGASSVKDSSEKMAVWSAKTNLGGHHATKHGTVWMTSHDCKNCVRAHAICLEVEPEDGGVYAYICPATDKESKFRFNHVAFRTASKCEAGSVRAYRSKA